MKAIVILMLGMICPALYGQEAGLIISHLTGDFHVYTTFKPVNGVPFPSNSMYVVTDSGVVLIDTPWDVTQTEPLLDSIERRHGKRVVMCIVTHFHDDRTAGLEILRRKGVRTYSTEQTLLLSRSRSEKEAEFSVTRDTTFRIGGLLFRTFHPGAGHTADNIVVWFPKARVLYGGCLVKSVDAGGLGNIADADLVQWPATIRKVMKRYPHPRFIVPGHHGWGSRKALQHTLNLLRKRTDKGR